MSDIINFVCLRIQSELDKFEKTRTIPHALLDGVFTMEDIENCKENMSPKYQRLAKRLMKEYNVNVESNIESMRESLKRDYNHILNHAYTNSNDFWFPTIATEYRKDINPVRALYYEVRTMVNTYNNENDKQVLLAGLITDKTFNNQLLDALAADISQIENLLKRYYWPMLKHSKTIPLELFHARQVMKDARHYFKFFENLQNWDPE